jgi:hypothetical protein
MGGVDLKISTRSVLTAGVAMLAASAVAIAPSVQPAPPPKPAATVQLVADVQPLALQEQPPLLTILLNSPLRLLGPAATPGTLPPPPAPIQFAIAPNLANTIDSVYIAVEPWVQYGFEVATAVVRWIPYVGWFAGQIMVFYHFFESMVASGVFNFTDWLRGDGGVVENLVDFGVDVGLAFVWLGLDELAQFVPLPPFCCYPPRPPVQGPFLALNTLLGPAETAELATAAVAEPSTTDVVESETPGNASEPAGKETAPGQLAKQATIAEPEETMTPPIKIKKFAEDATTDAESATSTSRAVQVQGVVRDTGASNGRPAGATTVSPKDKGDKGEKPETAKGATETSASSVSTSHETGKKDDTSKKDDTGKKE